MEPLAALLAAPCLLGLLAGGRAVQDRVWLDDGKELAGRVLLENSREVVVRVGPNTRVLARSEVERIESVERRLDALLDRQDDIDPEEAGGWIDLARCAEQLDLPDMALLAWSMALWLDPFDEAAVAALEPRGKGESLRFDLAGRSVRLADADEELPWKKRWKLSTPHFELEANVGLREAIETAFDLERIYRHLYELVGSEIGLFHLESRAKVELHADDESYPLSATPGRWAWFDAQSDTLYVRSSPLLGRLLLFHEATHLVFDHGFREGSSSGEIPPWADEGLAEYVAVSAYGDPGFARFDPGRRHDFHFLTHAQAERPLKLSRVLNLGRGDFLSGSAVDLAYAQSYTLVHFLMEDRSTALRERFYRFLESALRGKGGGTHFLDEIGMDEGRLEQEWTEYVRRIASGR